MLNTGVPGWERGWVSGAVGRLLWLDQGLRLADGWAAGAEQWKGPHGAAALKTTLVLSRCPPDGVRRLGWAGSKGQSSREEDGNLVLELPVVLKTGLRATQHPPGMPAPGTKLQLRGGAIPEPPSGLSAPPPHPHGRGSRRGDRNVPCWDPPRRAAISRSSLWWRTGRWPAPRTLPRAAPAALSEVGCLPGSAVNSYARIFNQLLLHHFSSMNMNVAPTRGHTLMPPKGKGDP